MSTDETTYKSSNKYHKNTHNYDDKPFHTSNSEDKLDNTRYTTNTRMGKVHVDGYNSKKHKYDAKHSHKPSDIEEDPRDQGTHTTETRSITKYRKGYNLKESNNIRLHKLPNFDSKLETLQSTERTENKIAIPLKNNYSKIDKIYRNYVQEASNTDGDVTKSPKNAKTNEINTTAETQSSQSQPVVLRAAFEKYYQTEHKHDKVLDFTETRSSDIGSHINTVPVTSSTENCDSSSELSENGIESHRIQTEDKFGTKWTWPTFERLLEVMGKRYDWRSDRWIELKHHANQKMTNADFINNFQEKHKFSYSTIKLNSTKSRRNVVIAVTAVR
ncbi:uncharacterized protein LOC113228551 [Hyposmocoma kahamanoa]|uniref:uncharacterized protein LOC113228551 n=1 Tax=Hyposmocoma kahamanoa TaxID=1477025 RepID=UPI000E6D796C|nr:uncharacterized protein LOC113228551 [Hyposmocoma kahamanoa]